MLKLSFELKNNQELTSKPKEELIHLVASKYRYHLNSLFSNESIIGNKNNEEMDLS